MVIFIAWNLLSWVWALEDFPVNKSILLFGWLLWNHVQHELVLSGEAEEQSQRHREMNCVKSWAEAKEHNEITLESYKKLFSAAVFFDGQRFWCIFPSVVLLHVKAAGKDEW